MFVLRREPPFAFVEDLENADHLLLWIAERHAQNVTSMEPCVGIDGSIKEIGFVRIFNDHRFSRNQYAAASTNMRIEQDLVGHAKSDFAPTLFLFLIEPKN